MTITVACYSVFMLLEFRYHPTVLKLTVAIFRTFWRRENAKKTLRWPHLKTTNNYERQRASENVKIFIQQFPVTDKQQW